jgi:hypothetical protein
MRKSGTWRQLGAALLLVLSLGVATQARAASVLLFIDGLVGTDYVNPALTALGASVTTATDWTDFNTRLATTPPQLAIALTQNSGLGLNLATMTTYLNSGGRAIVADWNETAALATLFNASFTGNTNIQPANFTIPALSSGITNPETLTNPGWGIWSTGLSAGPGGTSDCTFPNTDSCLVVGHNGHSVIVGFLSDTPQAADGVRLWENIINLALVSAPVVQVPTLSEWALFALGILLLAVAAFRLRRRG